MKGMKTVLAGLVVLGVALGCDPAGEEGAGSPDAGEVDSGDMGDAGDSGDAEDVGDIGDVEEDASQEEEDPEEFLACPPLAASAGTIVTVSPAEVGELPHLVRTAEPGTTFLFEPGTYRLPNTLHVRTDGITMRSATEDAESVVLDGEYDVNSLILVNGSDFTAAHLTVTRAVHHPIHIAPTGEATESVTGALIYGVRFIDGAQQFLKINGNGARTAFVDDGRVECSYFELTDEGRPFVDRSATGCYTGGINAHGARGWVVRNNEFCDIYCAGEGLAQHAVHFWSGSRDNLVEYNRIYGCARGIGFGLVESGGVREYDDDPFPEVQGYIGHYGGVIRNNLIVADHPYFSLGIELAQARGARVFHNTVYTVGADGFSSIDYRFANTEATIQNNLVDRITSRNGGQAEVSHNLAGIDASLFVDPDGEDFRLRGSAAAAIEQGVEIADAGHDLQGVPRPQGDAPDLGAYEYLEAD